MRFACLIAIGLMLGACVPATNAPEGADALPPVGAEATPDQMFQSVVAKVEPVAERLCRQRGETHKCNLRIVIDDRPGQPPNGFQTLDELGRPVIGFTLALIAEARNADELAFVLGHEAAHHIAGHISKQHEMVMSDVLEAGLRAKAEGKSPEEVKAAEEQAARARILTFSQDFELEADALGAEIALLAGFDPIKGSAFFDRLPEPGGGFRSTHPSNAKRKAVVRATVKRLLAALQ